MTRRAFLIAPLLFVAASCSISRGYKKTYNESYIHRYGIDDKKKLKKSPPQMNSSHMKLIYQSDEILVIQKKK